MNDIEENILRRVSGEYVATTYQRNELMLEAEKLDALSHLLEEMTKLKISDPKLAKLHLITTILLRCSGITFLFYVSVAFGLFLEQQRFGATPPGFHNANLVLTRLFGLTLLFCFLAGMTNIGSFLYMKLRGNPEGSYIFLSSEYILRRDAEFITRLLKFDKVTLAYGLLKYRHRWLSSERRAAIITGDLRKLGLLPALAALAAIPISAAPLLKEETFFRYLFVTMMVIFAIYYVIAFLIFLYRERSHEVTQLLEYAIQHADQ